MEPFFIALGHFVIAIGVFAALEIGHLWVLMQLDKKTSAQRADEMRNRVDLPWIEENYPEIERQLSRAEGDLYSKELFRNRLADLIGTLLFILNVFRSLLVFGILIYAIWDTVAAGLSNAVWIWWVLPVQITFILSSLSIVWLCKLLTGRLPNEPKQSRRLSRVSKIY